MASLGKITVLMIYTNPFWHLVVFKVFPHMMSREHTAYKALEEISLCSDFHIMFVIYSFLLILYKLILLLSQPTGKLMLLSTLLHEDQNGTLKSEVAFWAVTGRAEEMLCINILNLMAICSLLSSVFSFRLN